MQGVTGVEMSGAADEDLKIVQHRRSGFRTRRDAIHFGARLKLGDQDLGRGVGVRRRLFGVKLRGQGFLPGSHDVMTARILRSTPSCRLGR
jgi:hypothetical protein